MASGVFAEDRMVESENQLIWNDCIRNKLYKITKLFFFLKVGNHCLIIKDNTTL